MNSKITIIDYGMGNVGSIQKMIKKAGVTSIISSSENDILNSSKLILPGVGSYDAGMKELHKRGLIKTLNYKVIQKKIPILGICLGAQLMTEASEEGVCKGLGWLKATTRRFSFTDNKLKIPHMGWNRVKSVKARDKILGSESHKERFYFVHSYHFQTDTKEIILCKSNYGYEFASGLMQNNIIALQFHPEKSHNFGLKVIKNFIDY